MTKLEMEKKIHMQLQGTGTPPLTRFLGLEKTPLILVLKPQNGEYESLKSTFSQKSTLRVPFKEGIMRRTSQKKSPELSSSL